MHLHCCCAFSFACLPLLSVLCYCCSLLLVTVLSPLLSPLPLCRYFAIPAHCCREHVMITWCLCLDSVCVCSALPVCDCHPFSSHSFLTTHVSLSSSCALHTYLLSLSSIICSHRYGIIVGHLCVCPYLHISILFSNDSYRVVSIIIVIGISILTGIRQHQCQLSSDNDHINNTTLSLHQYTYTYW